MLEALTYFAVTGRANDPFTPCRTASGAGGLPRTGENFSLRDQHGQTVTQTELNARASLVYFGYAFCPDVCPLDLSRNAVAVDILSEHSHDVVPVFITLDPARDTPALLAQFAENLHPAMAALSGAPDQLRAAAATYRVAYEMRAPDADGHYLIDHSTLTYLVVPGRGPVEAFSRAVGPDDLAEQVACFLKLG